MSSARLALAAVLVVLAAGLSAACGGPGESGVLPGADPALPPVAAPAFAIGAPEPLARDGAEALWAPVRRVDVARAAASAGAPTVADLPDTTPEGTRNVVAVRRRVQAADGGLWVEVELPSTGAVLTGWVPREALGGYEVATATLHVDRVALRARLVRGEEELFSAPIGVGSASFPTPAGRFYVRNRLTRFRSAFYGPLAFGTSARSAVLTDWPAGGHVGIHGTDRPDLLPGAVSHGCIRMRNEDILRLDALMPVGTPVVIA